MLAQTPKVGWSVKTLVNCQLNKFWTLIRCTEQQVIAPHPHTPQTMSKKYTCIISSMKESLNKGQTLRWLLLEAHILLKQSVKRRATANFSSHAILRMILELPFIFLPTEIVSISCNFNTESSKEVIILCKPFCTLVNTTCCSVWMSTAHLNHNWHHRKDWMGLTRQYLIERLETFKVKNT